jgi:hypothetical protein
MDPQTGRYASKVDVLVTAFTNSFKTLDLRDIGKLSLCCTDVRGQCSYLLTSQRPYWLTKAVQGGCIQALSNLVHGNPNVLHNVIDELLSVPNLSLEMACELLNLGLRPTYKQIAGKARQGVTGVYIWARACQQMHLSIGMPPQAASMISGELLVRIVGF